VPSAWLVCLVCAWLMLVGVRSEAFALAPPAAVKNLAAWYDASDNTTLTTSTTANVITQMTDKSGNGETLTSSPSTGPVYVTSGINGLGSLQFSGAQYLLSNDMNFSRLLLPTSTVFIVQNVTNGSQYSSSIFSQTSNGYRYNMHLPWGSTVYLDFGDEGTGTSGNRAAVSTSTASAVGAHIWMADGSEGSTRTWNYDGTTIASGTLPNMGETFSCLVSIGAAQTCGGGFAYWFTGQIGEVIVYNAALSQANYQLVEGILACKWGLQGNLPSGHPWKSSCPSGTESTNLGAISGLSAWYDASDASTITTTTATLVSQITDKSGSGNTLTQSTQSLQPYVTTISGQQALEFSGSQSLASSTTNTFATGSNPSSIFVVATDNGNSTADVVSYGLCSAAMPYRLRAVAASTSGAVFSNNCFGDIYASSSWSTGSPPTIVFDAFGSSLESLAVNGGTVFSGSYVPTTPTSTALTLGVRNTGGYTWTGAVYEVLIYNSVPSTAERQFIEGYLACKWGLQSSLPSSHPYKSTCPATATPNLTLVAAVSPTGNQLPGTVLTYTTTYTNSSGTIAYNPTFSAAIPAHTDFRVGSLMSNAGSTGLSYTASYSSDGGSTWTYTPTSGAGGAASGYDRTVTNIRWVLSGALAPGSGVNSGTVGFAIKIQ